MNKFKWIKTCFVAFLLLASFVLTGCEEASIVPTATTDTSTGTTDTSTGTDTGTDTETGTTTTPEDGATSAWAFKEDWQNYLDNVDIVDESTLSVKESVLLSEPLMSKVLISTVYGSISANSDLSVNSGVAPYLRKYISYTLVLPDSLSFPSNAYNGNTNLLQAYEAIDDVIPSGFEIKDVYVKYKGYTGGVQTGLWSDITDVLPANKIFKLDADNFVKTTNSPAVNLKRYTVTNRFASLYNFAYCTAFFPAEIFLEGKNGDTYKIYRESIPNGGISTIQEDALAEGNDFFPVDAIINTNTATPYFSNFTAKYLDEGTTRKLKFDFSYPDNKTDIVSIRLYGKYYDNDFNEYSLFWENPVVFTAPRPERSTKIVYYDDPNEDTLFLTVNNFPTDVKKMVISCVKINEGKDTEVVSNYRFGLDLEAATATDMEMTVNDPRFTIDSLK